MVNRLTPRSPAASVRSDGPSSMEGEKGSRCERFSTPALPPNRTGLAGARARRVESSVSSGVCEVGGPGDQLLAADGQCSPRVRRHTGAVPGRGRANPCRRWSQAAPRMRLDDGVRRPRARPHRCGCRTTCPADFGRPAPRSRLPEPGLVLDVPVGHPGRGCEGDHFSPIRVSGSRAAASPGRWAARSASPRGGPGSGSG